MNIELQYVNTITKGIQKNHTIGYPQRQKFLTEGGGIMVQFL